VFEHLNIPQHRYKIILVSGMQRTGTTVCMKMIQHDLKLDKDNINWLGPSKTRFKPYLNKRGGPWVLHGPGLSHLLPEIGSLDNVFIIWMKRPFEEILASAQRIKWQPKQNLDNYGIKKTDDYEEDLRKLYEAKNLHWEQAKLVLQNYQEVDYSSLETHPLFLPKEQRLKFGTRDTK
jgi:hypothetical protein